MIGAKFFYQFGQADEATNLELVVEPWIAGLWDGIKAYESGETSEVKPAKEVQSEKQRNIVILYGSHTGNCRDAADELQAKFQSAGQNSKLFTLNEYKESGILNTDSEQHVMIICSTLDEGFPPQNSKLFYEYIQSTEVQSMAHINFSILGLGDSEYAETYQHVPKVLQECMLKNGAKEFYGFKRADET